jgi:DNA-binding transcriptional MerR regulator
VTAATPRERDTASLPFDFEAGANEGGPAREKSPQAFRTISEVGEELDIPAHVMRFWETKFPQLNPMKRGGGRRYYRPADVALLKGIRVALYDEGLTIKGLQKLLREKGVRHVAALGDGAAGDEAVVGPGNGAGVEVAAAARLHALADELGAIRDRLLGA